MLSQEMMVWLYGLEEIQITNQQYSQYNIDSITTIYLDAFNY